MRGTMITCEDNLKNINLGSDMQYEVPSCWELGGWRPEDNTCSKINLRCDMQYGIGSCWELGGWRPEDHIKKQLALRYAIWDIRLLGTGRLKTWRSYQKNNLRCDMQYGIVSCWELGGWRLEDNHNKHLDMRSAIWIRRHAQRKYRVMG